MKFKKDIEITQTEKSYYNLFNEKIIKIEINGKEIFCIHSEKPKSNVLSKNLSSYYDTANKLLIIHNTGLENETLNITYEVTYKV